MNSRVKKSKSKNRLEYAIFIGAYTLLLTINAVLVSSGTSWGTLNGVAVGCVAFSLWYYN